MAQRKKGSDLLAFLTGVFLIGLAAFTIEGHAPDFKDQETVRLVTGSSSMLFGIILLWWRFGRDSDWGIGGESVGMIVGVVTAVIAIFTLVQH
jgi:hypothetical protein